MDPRLSCHTLSRCSFTEDPLYWCFFFPSFSLLLCQLLLDSKPLQNSVTSRSHHLFSCMSLQVGWGQTDLGWTWPGSAVSRHGLPWAYSLLQVRLRSVPYVSGPGCRGCHGKGRGTRSKLKCTRTLQASYCFMSADISLVKANNIAKLQDKE